MRGIVFDAMYAVSLYEEDWVFPIFVFVSEDS